MDQEGAIADAVALMATLLEGKQSEHLSRALGGVFNGLHHPTLLVYQTADGRLQVCAMSRDLKSPQRVNQLIYDQLQCIR